MISEILARLLAERGVPTTPLTDGVRVARRGGTATYLNYNEGPATLPDGTTLGPVSFELRAT